MYATVLQLIQQFGIVEISRNCDGDAEPFLVTPGLFKRAANGQALENTSTEEQEAVAAALAKATAALTTASQRMDSFLGMRAALPLSPAVIAANGLPQICLNIARYLLQDDRATDEQRARYKDDMDWLKCVAKGDTQLIGQDGGAIAPVSGFARHGQAVSSIDWSRAP